MSEVKLTINRTAGIIVDEIASIDLVSESQFDNMNERRETKIRSIERLIYNMFEELDKIQVDSPDLLK